MKLWIMIVWLTVLYMPSTTLSQDSDVDHLSSSSRETASTQPSHQATDVIANLRAVAAGLSELAMQVTDGFPKIADPTKPDARMQDVLHRLVPPLKSEEEFRRNIETLRKMPTEHLIRQLLLFQVKAKSMEEAMTPGIVLREVKVGSADVVFALVDYLEDPDPDIRKGVKETLAEIEAECDRGSPNFSAYTTLLQNRKRAGEKLPAALIRHMYLVDAREALSSMEEATEASTEMRRALTWSDHVVGEVLWRKQRQYELDGAAVRNANTELEKMSQSELWWVRLYVATIMRSHPELRQPSLVEKLARDENELVRQITTSPLPNTDGEQHRN